MYNSHHQLTSEKEEPFICPSCGRQMTQHFESGYDSDNEWSSWWWYTCQCGTETWYDEFKKIPERYKASDKQIKTAEWIAWELGKQCPPHSKRALYFFIRENIKSALERAKYRHEHPEKFEDIGDDYGYEIYEPYF